MRWVTFVANTENMLIEYSKIIAGCKMLSAYDGKHGVGTDGQTLYKKVALTDSENDLIKNYVREGWKLIESRIATSLDVESSFGTTGITVYIDSDAERAAGGTSGINSSSLLGSVEETLQTFAMYRWLEDKNPTRSQNYYNMFNLMLGSTAKIALSKKKPELDD